ncbi:hypothetical protein AN191_02330 [Loktanella sp. 5RATIMAR09]|uniref:hypothetical protein n=1 Tax=Loktanella sp. 5RATIMAR09 TaxID=1225655 RepID=UPI0006EB7142|nr:hypothetical protein [Loktanella sp. 5RATIMAR09]KQI73722.1 hypothetical protein AN191_02330 [Loktanella sp. 5RATIMAR09]
MRKHVLDRPNTVTPARMVRAIAIERHEGPRKATLDLQRRKRQRASDARTSNFLRFARGLRP